MRGAQVGAKASTRVSHTSRTSCPQPASPLFGWCSFLPSHLTCDPESSQRPTGRRPPRPPPSCCGRYHANDQNYVAFAPPNKGRFVRENQVHDDGDADPNQGGDDAAAAAATSRELLCRIPEETLFQLQQIYEAIEESNGINSNGLGGVCGTGGKGNRRKSTSSLPSLTSLIYGSSGGGGDDMAVEEPVGPVGDAAEGSPRTPEKATKVRSVSSAFWRVVRPLFVGFFSLLSRLECCASKASFEHPRHTTTRADVSRWRARF